MLSLSGVTLLKPMGEHIAAELDPQSSPNVLELSLAAGATIGPEPVQRT